MDAQQNTVRPFNSTEENYRPSEEVTTTEVSSATTSKPPQLIIQPEPTIYPPTDVKYFIGGFNSDITEDDLREYFTRFGSVVDVQIMRDATSGRSRGFGFVTMADPSSRMSILMEKEHVIGGRKASVRPYSETDSKDSYSEGPILKRKIFVGGINPALGQEVLDKHFSSFGPLENATIMRYADGRSRGFGFVVFRDEAACQKVLQQRHHYITLRDRVHYLCQADVFDQVEVKPCLSREKSRMAKNEMTHGMRPMGHPYAGYYGYDGAGYTGAYPSYYGYSNICGPPMHGAPANTQTWSEYRDDWSAPNHPYDVYGGFYGWQDASSTTTGSYPSNAPNDQTNYASSAAAANVQRPMRSINTAMQSIPTARPRGSTVDQGYYHLGVNGGATSTAMNAPMSYTAVRRGSAGLPQTNTTPSAGMGYGAIPRGRAAPY